MLCIYINILSIFIYSLLNYIKKKKQCTCKNLTTYNIQHILPEHQNNRTIIFSTQKTKDTNTHHTHKHKKMNITNLIVETCSQSERHFTN